LKSRIDPGVLEKRYFPGDEPYLAARLDGFLGMLRDELAACPFAGAVRALMLAGGYGRGEGGIYREHDGSKAQLYNDLEFYLVLARATPAGPVEAWCRKQAELGMQALGVEVEFKLLADVALLRARPSMFFYDLLAAHRLIFGSEAFVGALPPALRDPCLIPPHEVTRLLFNRGSGLLFSACALRARDARTRNGFIERNHAKVRLALADAVLAVNGRYHFSCRERDRRLHERLPATPPDWPDLVAWHSDGVSFKFHPRHRYPPAAELQKVQEQLAATWLRTFLWVESLRLNKTFSDAGGYASYRGRLFPETGPLRNFALHARDRVKRGASLPHWFDYPRAALQRALALVLQNPPNLADAAAMLGEEKGIALVQFHDTYQRWWSFYN
jgi:hypothetical protein